MAGWLEGIVYQKMSTLSSYPTHVDVLSGDDLILVEASPDADGVNLPNKFVTMYL